VKNIRNGSAPDGDKRRPDLSMDRASVATITRLSSYYRVLAESERAELPTISSHVLAERCGVTSAQVRKDLSIFGNFGRRGLGYNVLQLRTQVGSILGLGRRWHVALIGAGNLGHALFAYKGFKKQGFHIEHVFDIDPAKTGELWGDIRIQPVAELHAAAAAGGVDIAILAVPAEAAQQVAKAVADAGIRAILNFTPGQLAIPATVAVRNVDLSIAIESLSYTLTK
jgi:redox-sensing transcriptional repressor